MTTKLLSRLGILGFCLLAQPVLAQPQLRSDVTVTAAIVTVGDMFDNAGLEAEIPLFRAPAPGTAGTVDLAAVEAAATRAGFSGYATGGLAGVRVARAAATVDEATLVRLIADDLRSRGILGTAMVADTRFDHAIDPVLAEAVDQPARLATLRYLPATGSFAARFFLAGVEQPLDVSGTIDLLINTPHLTRSLPAGSVLGASDIELRLVPVRFAQASGFATVDDLLGKALTRQSREGLMLKASDVAQPKLVARNAEVIIYLRQGPMTLTVKGQALNDAAMGEAVSVLNLGSKRIITGKASGPGAVEVDLRPTQVAGL